MLYVVSIPQAVGTIAIFLVEKLLKEEFSLVSIPQAVGTIAMTKKFVFLIRSTKMFQYRKR